MNKELLGKYGIEYEAGLNRCMGDALFYRTLLSMFRQDDCFQRAKDAYEKRDYKELFTCMHELKGTSGNVALSRLYETVCALVELLRVGNASDDAVDTLFAAVQGAYDLAVEGIGLFEES